MQNAPPREETEMNLSPGTNVTEQNFSFYVRQRGATAVGMMGVAERGPINAPALVTSWEQFVSRFGGYISGHGLAYAARSFFDNGGQQLWVNRVCHYTDPTDRSTATAIKAAVTLYDRSGVRASATTGASGDVISWRALHPGTAGNSISVTLAESGNNTPLSVAVDGSDITVNLATDEFGDSTSTISDVLGAVAASTPASALVTATSSEQASAVVSPDTKTTLSQGSAASASVTVTALDEGEWAHSMAVEVQDGTRNPATEFDLTVRRNGAVVERFQNLSLDAAVANSVVAALARSRYVRAAVAAEAPLGAVKRPSTGVYGLVGGDDGLDDMDDLDYVGDQAAHTGLYAFDDVALKLLTMPGITSGAVISAALGYAEVRQDRFCIFDAPAGGRDDVKDFRYGAGDGDAHAPFDSSFGALYWPRLSVVDPLTREPIYIPISGAVAGCYARTDAKDKLRESAAPAGVENGRIFGALGLEYQTQKPDRDFLYPHGINVVASFPDSGITVWGQRTLTRHDGADDRVNVRRTLIWLESVIGSGSRVITFRPNIPETWRALVRLVSPVLIDARDRGALEDFRLQCDEETNPPSVRSQNQLVCRVFVKPTKTAEFIEIPFVVTDTDTSFTEIFTG